MVERIPDKNEARGPIPRPSTEFCLPDIKRIFLSLTLKGLLI
jgi:hypothetical protein